MDVREVQHNYFEVFLNSDVFICYSEDYMDENNTLPNGMDRNTHFQYKHQILNLHSTQNVFNTKTKKNKRQKRIKKTLGRIETIKMKMETKSLNNLNNYKTGPQKKEENNDQNHPKIPIQQHLPEAE